MYIRSIVDLFMPKKKHLDMFFMEAITSYYFNDFRCQKHFDEASPEVTKECLKKVNSPAFIDSLFEDFDNFFGLEDLKKLSDFCNCEIVKKIYSDDTENPINKLFVHLHQIAKEEAYKYFKIKDDKGIATSSQSHHPEKT